MQRYTARSATTDQTTSRSIDRCPVCDRGIEGIEATGAGHRFVGCGHSASTRPLPTADGPTLAGVTIG